MNTEANHVSEVLRALVERLVDRPDEVRVGASFNGDGAAAVFEVECHPNDESKLIGKQGAHVNALGFLVEEFGLALGMRFSLRLITVREARPQAVTEQRASPDYDPTPTRDLLVRILEATRLGGFAIDIGESPDEDGLHVFIFLIGVETAEAQALLTDSRRYIVRKTRPERGKSELAVVLSLANAMKTLLWAVAKCDGVKFYLSVKEDVAP